MPPANSTQVIRFGVFQLDVRAAELHKRGVRLAIQGLPLQVLGVLLQHAGQVVTREELRKELWPADTFVDYEHSLHNAIARLREALGDSADSPRFIETLPRRGYRFIAPVEGATSRPQDTASKLVASRSWRPSGGWWRLAAMLALGLSAIVVLSMIYLRRERRSTEHIASLAVLPLQNLSADPEQEYFADGMTEELTTNLGKIAALRVISHTSTMRYKNTQKPLPEIARELQVDALVEGTVARSGDHVRVTTNLVQAFPEKHLWAESYERDLRDVLSLQSELARAITYEIRVKLTPAESSRLASASLVNPEAYQLYLKGRYFWNKRTKDGLKKALEFLNQAVTIDPNYAQAYAAIAECYPPSAYFGFVPPNEALPMARTAALRALDIDESVSQAHSVLAAERMFYEWDWTGAEKEFRRAIELNPGDATAHSWFAQYLVSTGHGPEALEQSKLALLYDPFSTVINLGLGHRLYWLRQYDQAIEQCRKTQELLELDPNYEPAVRTIALSMAQKGERDKAITLLRKSAQSPEQDGLTPASLGHLYGLAGNAAEAQRIIHELKDRSGREYVDPYALALVYSGLGQKDKAFSWLQKASDEHSPLLTFLKVEPMLDPVRSDPRFQQLIRRMGLAP